MIKLEDYKVSPETGFLPEKPIVGLDISNATWEKVLRQVPKLLLTGRLEEFLAQLPPYQINTENTANLERDMRVLSYLTHAYLWGKKEVPALLPAYLSVPFVTVAQKLGRPAILSYPSYCLFNWQRIDENKPPHIGNLLMTENFLGGADEDWFILIHVEIEAKAARALRAIPATLFSAEKKEINGVIAGLKEVLASLQDINQTMNRMPEYCDPYIYYTRVRPYIFGTKNNPAMPNGLQYEGCFDGKAQFYRGETGAQSAIVPTIDGLLGIRHENDMLKEYLMEMREYMVQEHRRFIEKVESESKVRSLLAENPQHDELQEAYKQCFTELHRFRSKHLEYAANYIAKQAAQSNNSTEVGTGGTPFMRYLAKHRDETNVDVQQSL
ncbi:MAG: indoleamine 2,3-dioxygenase [Thermoflexibacter sp.]|jgi:indoleamine 2,3-dioxygenase|nr:indoleamine 2,3-dioxygenase [Thermoflexibacter sp.]